MMTRLTGRIESIDDARRATVVPLPDAGIAYEVLLPGYAAEALEPALGTTVTLFTLQILESPNQGASFVPRLMGFVTANDRAFFEVLTSVRGLSTRKGLKALAIEPARIATAIINQDTVGLTKLPEIGKKMASTLVTELAEKVGAFIDPAHIAPASGSIPSRPGFASTPQATGPVAEAIEALVSLGEQRSEAERKILVLTERSPELKTADELIAAHFAPTL